MSRTDKDTPLWVRFEWAEPFHFCSKARSYQKAFNDCDLPDEPPKRSRQHYSWFGLRKQLTNCHWVPCDRGDHQSRYIKNKRAWRRELFYGPQRRAVRDAAISAKYGNVDVEFPEGRARHGVLWDMW